MIQKKEEELGKMIKKDSCSCPEKSCLRHGKCEQCQVYHHAHGEKTNCGK